MLFGPQGAKVLRQQGFLSPQRPWQRSLCHSVQTRKEINDSGGGGGGGERGCDMNGRTWKCFLYNFDVQNVNILHFFSFPDAFLDAFISMLQGSRAPVAWGNFFLMCCLNSKTLIQCCKALLRLWRAEDSNSWKQQALLAFDSEHNSAAWGFGVSVRLGKSFGHVLGVLNVVWHQSLLFGVWEWEAEVIDIRQASVLSLRGIGMWWVERGF